MVCWSRAEAQQPQPGTAVIRGSVVDAETGAPLAYSIVVLEPPGSQRFTDQAGAVTFRGLTPGRYHVVARQIGYSPLDTAVAAPPGGVVVVRLALTRLAIELAVVTVTGTRRCLVPGPPDTVTTPKLAAVFGQVIENARRFKLMADSYPYQAQMLRTLKTGRWDGSSTRPWWRNTDTIVQESRVEWHYQPGKIVAWGSEELFGEQVVRLPGLRDFADSAFQYTHCFLLAGRDTLYDEPLIRLDFTPAVSLGSTDVDGSTYLDSATYQIRYTIVRLTKPDRAIRGAESLVATTRYRLENPGVVVRDWTDAITTYYRSASADHAAWRIEEWTLMHVHFLRALGSQR